MSAGLRRVGRFCIWVALCLGLALVRMIDYTLAGVCLLFCAPLLLEGVLVFALIRLRDPAPPRMSILQGSSST